MRVAITHKDGTPELLSRLRERVVGARGGRCDHTVRLAIESAEGWLYGSTHRHQEEEGEPGHSVV